MEQLKQIDNKISEISKEIDFYACLTPLNQGEERVKFFERLSNGNRYNPVFEYQARDLRGKVERLDRLEKQIEEQADSTFTFIFTEKVKYIKRQVDILVSGDDRFGEISSRLYGSPGKEDVNTCEAILFNNPAQEDVFPDETVSPEEMMVFLKESLKKKGVEGWKVSLNDKIVPKLSVSGRDFMIYVNPAMNYTKQEMQRLVVHEIEVHVYRAINGARQPFRIFSEGLAGYDETEEGMAVNAEERSGCLLVDKRQIRLYAGRCLAVKTALKKSFFDTFIILRDLFSDELAYRLTERVKRGMRKTSRIGAFTKDTHYISGLNKLRRYIAVKGDLKTLYAGKIGIDNAQQVRDLIEKGFLKKPEYFPEYV